jgi:uncharacterized protein (TIGR02421 family)
VVASRAGSSGRGRTGVIVDAVTLDAVNAATRRWRAATHGVGIDGLLSPTNLVAERTQLLREWQSGRRYEPRFEYRLPEAELIDRVADAAESIDANDPLTAALAADLGRTEALLSALRRHDSACITRITVHQYGEPTSELLDHAWDVLAGSHAPAGVSAILIPASDAAAALAAAIAKAGLEGWSVDIAADMSARMSVNSVTLQVRVRADAAFSTAEIARLTVHELGTHVARSANGGSQPLEILAVGIPGYLATEEGLAAWHEQRHGVSDPMVLRRYALRVIAADQALRAGFWETFEVIVEHTDPDDAFSIVQRAKRGIFDPLEPGAHVKDVVYLSGLRQVEHHLASHPGDYRLLMCGKVALTDIPLLRRLDAAGLLVDPRVGPSSFHRTPRSESGTRSAPTTHGA